jgi:hypothetical protein
MQSWQMSDDSDYYSSEQLLARLLELGKAQDFEAVRQLSRDVRLRNYPSYGDVINFSTELDGADLDALVKAIGMFEDVRGGGGSPTMNGPLILWGPRRGSREAFDWVLRNCRWYYSKGARSLAEYERIEIRDALLVEQEDLKKLDRHLEAFRRKAAAATASVCGAIRRRDHKALSALLKKGADPDVICPDGSGIHDFVNKTGDEQLIQTVEAYVGFRNLMKLLTDLGNEGRFAEAADLGARCRSGAIKGISVLAENPTAGFRDELSPEHFEARAKGLAMFEMGYGWQGRQSFVTLLAYHHRGDNRMFDWILRNTTGWYYAWRKRSLEEFESDFGELYLKRF